MNTEGLPFAGLIAGSIFPAPMFAAAEVARERDTAAALGLSDAEFNEVYDLCGSLGTERGWNRETFLYHLHERVMIRGGVSGASLRHHWDVPDLSMLDALLPDEVSE